jgi:hypothetical protein
MRKILKFSVAALLTITLGIATVLCCCAATAAAAQLHKVSMCGHCPAQKSSPSSLPNNNCLYQLTNAEAAHGQDLSLHAPVVSSHGFFLHQHIATSFLPSTISSYPRGSPPLSANVTPLYLRTFTLRI